MMLPLLFRVLRQYAPYITMPVAVVIGVIGYHIENTVSDKYTPYQESVVKQRVDRLAREGLSADDPLKEKKFVPKSIFERNLSPSLATDEKA